MPNSSILKVAAAAVASILGYFIFLSVLDLKDSFVATGVGDLIARTWLAITLTALSLPLTIKLLKLKLVSPDNLIIKFVSLFVAILWISDYFRLQSESLPYLHRSPHLAEWIGRGAYFVTPVQGTYHDDSLIAPWWHNFGSNLFCLLLTAIITAYIVEELTDRKQRKA